MLNAETQLLSAQLSLAQEQINFKVFYLDLLRDMGRLPLPKQPLSMSSGPTSKPTTQETSPLAPSLRGGAGGLPSGAGYPSTQPGLPGAPTQPTTSPTTFPSIDPTTFPKIDFNLQPTIGPDTAPAQFPDTQSATLPTTAPPISPRPRRRPG